MGDQESKDNFFNGKISVREFLVDFFGALMPGTLFLMLLFVGLLLPTFVLLLSIESVFSDCEETLGFIRNTGVFIKDLSTVAHLSIFFLMLATSYVIGTVFYRRDPKAPDYSSFITIAKKFAPGELDTWVVLVKDKHASPDDSGSLPFIKDNNKISKTNVDKSDVQFPYNNLKNYLKERGWEKLSNKITWDVNDDPSKSYRSKTFINALKIRLQIYCPEHCSTIIKNEAHVRLTSSMWYSSKALIFYSSLGLVFLFISMYISNNWQFILYPISASIGVILFSWRVKKNSQHFLHYQRVREIFYVLETAFVVSQERKIDLFEDIM